MQNAARCRIGAWAFAPGYCPADPKSRDFAVAAVPGAVRVAVSANVRAIVLCSDRANNQALASYRTLGCTATGDFGLFNFLPGQQ